MAVAGDAKDRRAGSNVALKFWRAERDQPWDNLGHPRATAARYQNAPCNEIDPYGAPPSWW